MFKLRKKNKRIIFCFFFIFLFFLERCLKFFYLRQGEVFYNKNIAFNIYLEKGVFYFLFSLIFTILILCLIISFKKEKFFLIFSFSFILVGALSNLIDRFLYDAIIDHWQILSLREIPQSGTIAIFNLADLYIFLGILMLLVSIWRKDL